MAKVFGLLGVATVLFAGPALAHHSHAHYEPLKEVTISGTVTEFHWINPHSWVNISVMSEDGQAQEWALETDGGIGRLVRQRWTIDSMAPGDIIEATVKPLRDGSYGGLIQYIELADGTILGQVERTFGQ